jgi:superfamily II DNA or RNA helicase
MPLRDYQQKLVDDALQAIRAGKNPLVVLPPGGGKTHVMAAILEQFKRTLSIAHRIELTSKLKKLLPSDAHKVATVQSGIESLGPLELLAIDEAHHAPAKTYQRIIDDASCPVLGVTATPCRMDGRGLGSIFDVLLEGPDVATLTEMGYLMPFDLYSAKTEIDVAGISKGVSGDYAPGSAAKAATARTITADAVQEWLDKADGRQTIVFTCTVDHARQVQQQYLSAGIRAEVITGNSKDRHELLPAFERKEFPVLINCEIAIEGIDIPSCECVQILRPTNSIRIYDQMIGRLLRPSGRRGVILDHAHTWERLGYPFAGRTWSLDGVEVTGDLPKVCPSCGAVVEKSARRCVCGHEFTGEGGGELRTPPTVGEGILKLVDEFKTRCEDINDCLRDDTFIIHRGDGVGKLMALALQLDMEGVLSPLEMADAVGVSMDTLNDWLLLDSRTPTPTLMTPGMKRVVWIYCIISAMSPERAGEVFLYEEFKNPTDHWYGWSQAECDELMASRAGAASGAVTYIDLVRAIGFEAFYDGIEAEAISEGLCMSKVFLSTHTGAGGVIQDAVKKGGTMLEDDVHTEIRTRVMGIIDRHSEPFWGRDICYAAEADRSGGACVSYMEAFWQIEEFLSDGVLEVVNVQGRTKLAKPEWLRVSTPVVKTKPVRMTLDLDTSLHKKLGRFCYDNSKTKSEVVRELLEKLLSAAAI